MTWSELVGSGHYVVRFNFRTGYEEPSFQIITDADESINKKDVYVVLYKCYRWLLEIIFL